MIHFSFIYDSVNLWHRLKAIALFVALLHSLGTSLYPIAIDWHTNPITGCMLSYCYVFTTIIKHQPPPWATQTSGLSLGKPANPRSHPSRSPAHLQQGGGVAGGGGRLILPATPNAVPIHTVALAAVNQWPLNTLHINTSRWLPVPAAGSVCCIHEIFRTVTGTLFLKGGVNPALYGLYCRIQVLYGHLLTGKNGSGGNVRQLYCCLLQWLSFASNVDKVTELYCIDRL